MASTDAQRAAASKPMAAETDEAVEGFGPDFKPLNAEEASRWRARQSTVSPWHVLAGQAGAGVLIALGAWLWGGRAAGWSAAWGALSVLVPAMLFARALVRRPSAGTGASLLRLMVWETVKVVVTLAMLLVSPRVVAQLSWPILVASFVVTMKMYWVGWWLLSRRRTDPV